MSHEQFDNFDEWFELGGENVDLIVETGRTVLAHADQILDGFYKLILSREETRGFFPDSQTAEHAKSAQKAHWERLFSGKFDRHYFESAKRVGRVHFKIQLPFMLYLGGYSEAGTRMLELILSEKGFGTRKRKIQKARLLIRLMLADCERVIESYFEAQQEEQTKALNLLTSGIERLEKGDMTKKIRESEGGGFPQKFAGIRLSYNNLIDRWSGVISDATEKAVSVDAKMANTVQLTQEMASRAEDQAATLEEAVAAVSRVTAGTKETKSKVSEATLKSQETQESAERGGIVVEQAIKAVIRIEQSSEKIAKFIDVIEDISFQTNLLALNAGVEAARAGDAGRGFAVVASEVRALAARASQSAVEIKSLIASSSNQVREGCDLVRKTGESLESIRAGANQVSTLMEEVTSVISDQSLSLVEIDTSMNHLGHTTQDNAAKATDVFDTAAKLAGDSAALKGTMEGFETNQNARLEVDLDRDFQRAARA